MPCTLASTAHVWSIDTTRVLCWSLWSIQVPVAIDHFSRKVVCIVPLEGPNAGWIIEAQEQALQKHRAPKHIISDRASVFVADTFAELLKQWNIKARFGAVGKSGSIAVTERVIKTLKSHMPSFQRAFAADSAATRRPHRRLTGTRVSQKYRSPRRSFTNSSGSSRASL